MTPTLLILWGLMVGGLVGFAFTSLWCWTRHKRVVGNLKLTIVKLKNQVTDLNNELDKYGEWE